MRVRSAAAVVLVAALALAGCSDDDPPDPEPSAATSSTPSPSPSATPTAEPKEPALPDAATKATEAGARAFITYYWDLINYAQVTGDVKALKKVSGPRCDGCRGGINAISAIYRDGGRAEGGTYTVRIVTIRKTDFSDSDVYSFESRIKVKNTEQTILAGDGSTRTLRPTENAIEVALLWVAEAWRLDVLVVQ